MTFYLKIYGCHKISFEKTSETSFILKTNSLNDVFQKQQVLSHDNFYPFGKKNKTGNGNNYGVFRETEKTLSS